MILHRIVKVSCVADEYKYIKKKLRTYQMHTQALKGKNGKMIDALFVTDANGNEHCFEFSIDSFFYEPNFEKRTYGDKINAKRKKATSNQCSETH